MNAQIVIYPNPADGIIKIVTPQSLWDTELILMDMLGNKVFSWNDFSEGSIDLSSFERGTYVLEFQVQHTPIRKPIILN